MDASVARERTVDAPRWFAWLHVIVWLSVALALLFAALVLVQGYQIASGSGMSVASIWATTDELRGVLSVPSGWRISGTRPDIPIPVAPSEPRMSLAVAYVMTALPPALVNLAALWMVARLMATPALITTSVLFSGATADRLRRIGWFIIIATIAVSVHLFVMAIVIQTSLLPHNVFWEGTSVMGAPLVQPALWFGIALIGLAEIVRRGYQMREDLEGVV